MSHCRLTWNLIVNPIFHCVCHMALEVLLITGRHPMQAKQVNNRVDSLSTLARVSAFSLSRSFRGGCSPHPNGSLCSLRASPPGPGAHIAVSDARAALQLPPFLPLALCLRDTHCTNQDSGFSLISLGSKAYVIILLASLSTCVSVPFPTVFF